MSQNSNPNKPVVTPKEGQTPPPVTPQGQTPPVTSDQQPPANDGDQDGEKKGVTDAGTSRAADSLSADEIDARIADGVAKGIAAYQQQQAEQAEADQLKEKQMQEAAEQEKQTLQTEALAKQATTWPYGNQDTKQEFDLSKMTNWGRLPDDKVVVVLPKFNTDGAGNKIGYDVKNSLVQPVDIEKHKIDSTPAKVGGYTTYGLLGMDPIVVHDPSL